MRTRSTIMAIPIAAALAAVLVQGEPEYTSDFRLEFCDRLVPHGSNAYFGLNPGRFWRLEGEDDGEFVEVEIMVLDQTRTFSFDLNGRRVRVNARVVREREWVDGELVEISRNYFARCVETGNIFYFGEHVDNYEDGEIINHDGTWLAGVNDAVPGLIMPSTFILGARYYQEIAPEVALDRALNSRMGLNVDTPAGEFGNCVLVVETTPLEPDARSIKIYAPRVGIIGDDSLRLVEYGF